MKNFKEISELIKIGQVIENNIMDWMNYYEHKVIIMINIKGFNEADYLVLSIKFRNKNFEEEIHSLTVGIHKNEIIKYENYKYILDDLIAKVNPTLNGYLEKYGVSYISDKLEEIIKY